jgi:hypothetical protein
MTQWTMASTLLITSGWVANRWGRRGSESGMEHLEPTAEWVSLATLHPPEKPSDCCAISAAYVIVVDHRLLAVLGAHLHLSDQELNQLDLQVSLLCFRYPTLLCESSSVASYLPVTSEALYTNVLFQRCDLESSRFLLRSGYHCMLFMLIRRGDKKCQIVRSLKKQQN